MSTDLRSLLLAELDVGVVAWSARPQGSELPALVLSVVSEVTYYTYLGVGGLMQTRVQADALGASFLAAATLADALKSTVGGYHGTVGGTVFAGIFLDGGFADTTEAGSGAAPIHRFSRDLIIHHKEA